MEVFIKIGFLVIIFLGEENEVNLEEVILGCLRDIRGVDILEVFIFLDL